MSEDTPDFSLGPFRLWVLGRQFPDAQDFWDGNWLNVIADCELNRARVAIEGPYLHLSELETWRNELEEIDRKLSGTASVGHIEPNLRVVVQAKKLGQLEVELDITPENVSQSHRFTFELDQTYLPRLISGLNKILRKYPKRA
jgi:hypothetical protein